MKRISILLVFCLLASVLTAQDLLPFLKSCPEIKKVELIKCDDFFSEGYRLMISEPIDYKDTTKGYFLQKVFVFNKSKDAPVVLVTEGYAAGYAERPNYQDELCPLLNASLIVVEHRYFGDSWPEEEDWNYLTVENAAGDHHRIVSLFKKYFPGKWVNTGVSKGGQTALAHRFFYPGDVDVTVAYVAPLNFGVEDGRHERFIPRVPGTPEKRKQIFDFQLEVLKRREKLMPGFLDFIRDNKFTFRIGTNEIFDFCVLEYPFVLWQYGKGLDEVPDPSSSDETLLKHLLAVASPHYFSLEGIEPIRSFFVQAARELGYYGYDTKSYRKYLKIRTAEGYLPEIFLPEGLKISYWNKTALLEQRFLNHTDRNMLFIYGEFDPWSASAVNVPEKQNLLKIVEPGGNHSAKIGNLPADQKELVINTLEKWLGIPVSRN